MVQYLIKRLLLAIPTVLGVVFITFCLFTLTVKDPARAFAGRQASEEQIRSVAVKMGVDKPYVQQFFDLITFQFHQSMRYERSVWSLIAEKGPVSLAVQAPAFVISLGLQLAVALVAASRKGSVIDFTTVAICILLMAVPTVSIYLGFQFLLGADLRVLPVAGWDSGLYALQYMAMPILASVVVSAGPGVLLYRTVILEQLKTDYTRTARAKGVPERTVLFVHVLKNVMIPVVTNTVAGLPFLILGSLLLERIFQIPGLGGLLIDAVLNNDRSVAIGITYLIAITYTVMLIVSDVVYAWVDPRVRLA